MLLALFCGFFVNLIKKSLTICLWIYCKKNPYQYLYDMAFPGVFHGHCAAEKGYSRCQMGSVFRGGTVCCSVCIAVKPAIVKDFLEKIKKRIP